MHVHVLAGTPACIQRPCGLKADDFTLEEHAALFDAHNNLVRCVVPPGRLLVITMEGLINRTVNLGVLADFLQVTLVCIFLTLFFIGSPAPWMHARLVSVLAWSREHTLPLSERPDTLV